MEPSISSHSSESQRWEGYVLLSDQPVEDATNDLLDTARIADGIASMLSVSRASAPFVVAVDAGWGMGKSSLLRILQSRMVGRPGVTALSFNAWTAVGDDALEGLIKSVLVELDGNVVRRAIRRLARRRRTVLAVRVVAGMLARFVGLTRLVDDLWARLEVDPKSRNELRDVIKDMLSEWTNANAKGGRGRTLVIFVDDLDRCPDDVVVKVCEAIKLYLDAPGLMFVLACDLSVLSQSVVSSTPVTVGEGRTYLEKIVQVAYKLPPPDDTQIGQLIKEYARQAGLDGVVDDTVVHILTSRTGHNPRRIKRIINSMVLEHLLNSAWQSAPLSTAQLVRAIVLQHLYAPFYEVLASEDSSADPIGDFLDYAEVFAKAADPPAKGDFWWSVVRRTYKRFGLPVPAESSDINLDLLRPQYPEPILRLVRNRAFIALLQGFGEEEDRLALRHQLLGRPLGVEATISQGPQSEVTGEPDRLGLGQVGDRLYSVSHALSELMGESTGRGRALLAQQIIAMALDFTVGLIGGQSRAAWYELKDAETLQLVKYAGAAGMIRQSSFKLGVDADKAVFDHVSRNELLFVAGANVFPLGGQDVSIPRGYEDFVAVPVATAGTVYGLITVDTPELGDIHEDHLPFIRTVAGFVAMALAASR